MKKFFGLFFSKNLDSKFKDNAVKIKEENTKALNCLYWVGLVILLCVYILELCLNLFSISHHIFIAFGLIFLVEAILSLTKVKKPSVLIRIDIIIFMILAYSFAILIDNVLTGGNSLSLFLMFVLIFSVIFIEKPHITSFITLFFLAVFLVSSYLKKSIDAFVLDAVFGVIIFVIGLMMTYLILAARIKNLDINRKLGIKSNIDELSGLFNRRSYNEYSLKNYQEFVSTTGKNISIIMFDVDYFKNYNDTYGHLKGDECLGTVSKILKDIENEFDVFVARFGGEEFVIVAKDKTLKETKDIAKQVVCRVKSQKIEHKTSPIGMVTISAGCSAKIEDEIYDPIKLVNLADNRLYRAKLKGKNRVE